MRHRFARNFPCGRKVRCVAAMNLSEKILVTGKIYGVMNKLFTISLLTGIMLCGCQASEPEISNVPEPQTFTAIIENNNDSTATRTSLDEQRNVLWTKGDQVSIFAGSAANAKYQVSDDSDGKTSATLNMESTSSFVTGSEIENNVAYYPYSANVQIEKKGTAYTISGITLPATQAYATASFGNGAFPMAAITASTKDTNLGFKNVLGGLKLQLKGTASIASISVSGNANEILCGSADVTVSSEATPTIELTDKSATTVTLDCGTAGVQLNSETATTFIIALPPVTMASGFTVTIKDIYGKQMQKISTNSQTIARSTLLTMSEFPYTVDSSVTDYTKEPLTITSIGKTSVALARYVGDYETNTDANIALQYRINSGGWKTYTVGGIINLADADALQFRPQTSTGNSTFSSDEYYYKFKVGGEDEGKVIASGNVMSLLSRTFKSVTSAPEYCFYALFEDVDNLVSAADLQLPATELSKYCYYTMFSGCTALVRPPKQLPATELAEWCYSSMFRGCKALVGAPELPATKMAERCYNYMFYDCTSLKEAPALPAKRLANHCYYCMFNGCTSLVAAPELPAIDLTSGPNCYTQMFHGCTSLTSAPKLPATALSQGCYYSMFEGCTSLTTAPELNATTLANACYKRMFYNCTGLTAAPDLPATTLVDNCYNQMFSGCKNLSYIEAMFTTEPVNASQYSGHTWEWLSGVASEGTFVKNEDATWDVTGINGIPTGWTVATR